MDAVVKSIRDYCEGMITFSELHEEAKIALMSSNLMNENGEFTETGEHYRSAIIAKSDPNIMWSSRVRP